MSIRLGNKRVNLPCEVVKIEEIKDFEQMVLTTIAALVILNCFDSALPSNRLFLTTSTVPLSRASLDNVVMVS